MALILLATVVLLVALTGLSAFQARRHPRLVWAAFLVPAVGALVSIVGVVGMAAVGIDRSWAHRAPWVVWMLGTVGMLIGSGLFALATWRVDALPRAGAVVLAVGAVTVMPVLAGMRRWVRVGRCRPRPVRARDGGLRWRLGPAGHRSPAPRSSGAEPYPPHPG